MTAASNSVEDPDICGICSRSLLPTRYVYVHAATYSVVCSRGCFRAAHRVARRALWAARRRTARRLVVGVVLAGGLLTAHQGPAHQPGSRSLAKAARAPAKDPGPPAPPPGWFGPEWPPTETSLLAALGRDIWVHPLAGPVRRMPRADSRVFGAVRPGNRPVECRNGHCGVDLGGEIWGEHIYAVHDGVVDFVQRGPNPDRGGSFVRISHRDGTVFSWYFHVAAIPRNIERGVRVKSGQLIGLLGDTGVKQSAPHLHFAMSVKQSKEGYERYMDPEPLIALWPLRVPIVGTDTGMVSLGARVGVPLGSALRGAGHSRPATKPTRPRAGAKPGTGATSSDGSEESDSGESSGADETEAPSTDPASED
jgi:murein DD-endopeptidase MepM/ murein hydrolase activator NlpD